jgi:hypothetical protein
MNWGRRESRFDMFQFLDRIRKDGFVCGFGWKPRDLNKFIPLEPFPEKMYEDALQEIATNNQLYFVWYNDLAEQ